jgi:hypothetical protein
MKRVRVLVLVGLAVAVAGLGLSLSGSTTSTKTGTLTGEIRWFSGGLPGGQTEIPLGSGVVVVQADRHMITTQSVAMNHRFRFVLSAGSYSIDAREPPINSFVCAPVQFSIRSGELSSVQVTCISSEQ